MPVYLINFSFLSFSESTKTKAKENEKGEEV